jgi:hypothetical protein
MQSAAGVALVERRISGCVYESIDLAEKRSLKRFYKIKWLWV